MCNIYERLYSMVTVNNLMSTVNLTSNNKNNHKMKEYRVSFQGSQDEFASKTPRKKGTFLAKLKSLFSQKKPVVEIKKDNKQASYMQNKKKAFCLIANNGIDSNLASIFPEKYLYLPLRDKYYETIRYCRSNPYKMRESCSDNISNFVSKPKDGIFVIQENGWCYRGPKKLGNVNISNSERLSLSVYPEVELINKLDNFILRTGVNAEYKVPNSNTEWLNRHENMIIYFDETLTPEYRKELVNLIAPHTRKTDDRVMIGTKLDDGIYLVKEPTSSDVLALLKRAEALDFDDGALIRFLKSPSANLFNKYGQVWSSPAVVKSTELMLDALEQIKVN